MSRFLVLGSLLLTGCWTHVLPPEFDQRHHFQTFEYQDFDRSEAGITVPARHGKAHIGFNSPSWITDATRKLEYGLLYGPFRATCQRQRLDDSESITCYVLNNGERWATLQLNECHDGTYQSSLGTTEVHSGHYDAFNSRALRSPAPETAYFQSSAAIGFAEFMPMKLHATPRSANDPRYADMEVITLLLLATREYDFIQETPCR